MGEIRTFSKRTKWSDEDVSWLIENYKASSREQLANRFPSRKVANVECKANMLGLAKPRRVGMSIEEVRESKKLHMRRRREADPQAVRDYQRNKRLANPDKSRKQLRDYVQKRFFWRRALKLNGDNKATYIDLARMWKRQRGRCALTGRRLTRADSQLDHIVPRARGGTDDIGNLRWLCVEANLCKRDLTDSELLVLCRTIALTLGERLVGS